uniref:Reverse transcriptase N-terminal domain-containing protein n=1 Tax=Herposiphonia versicolor TaxID=2007163 RepID=A0A1Z1MG65_9FLOR|nr:hypothetical protein [Herposiphonia versicolor]ARW64751.1 hypothetical protein [Herposiphonia versicolor]
MYISINKYKINIFSLIHNISWQRLPWQKIELRVLVITKQIYIATKKNDLISVYYLQNYLINCIEVRLLFIKKTLEQIQYNYNRSRKINIFMRNINKFQLLKSLSVNNLVKNKLNQLIIKKIQKNIIYTSIEPTWRARYSKSFLNIVNNSLLYQQFSCFNKKNLNFLLIKTIIKKFNCYNFLQESIKRWMHYNIFFILNEKLIQQINYSNIENLLNHIIFDNNNWYIFKNLKQNPCLKHEFKLLNIETENNDYKLFNVLTKKILYRDNLKSFKKINFFDNSKNILTKVKMLYKYHCSILKILIKIKSQQYSNKLINLYTNVWIKKQISTQFLASDYIYSLKKVNNEINCFVYSSNMIKIYLSK